MSQSGVRLTDQADLIEENTTQQQNYSVTEQKFNQTSNSDVLLKGQALNIQDLCSEIEEVKSNNTVRSPSEVEIEFSAVKQDISYKLNASGGKNLIIDEDINGPNENE